MKPGLRDRKREATYASLSQSAMRLFAKRGFENVTVEEIADACELSPRTFFRYFASKEDVLFAGTDARRSMLLHLIDSQPPGVTVFEAIAGASRIMGAHYLPDRDAFRVRAQIIEAAPSLQSRDAGLPRQWDRDVLERLQASGRADGLDDLELSLLVGASMTALRVSMELWISSDADLIDLIDAAFGRLAAGLNTETRRPRRRKAG